MKPVNLACEIYPVYKDNHKTTTCVARFTQQHGAKSSFEMTMKTLKKVLGGRGLLIADKKKAKQMRMCLRREAPLVRE